MPTGYTADVNSGKVTEFKEYALQCARAFGACILMRDDPADTPIPDEFPADVAYHDKALIDAKALLFDLERMSDKERISGCDSFNIQAQREYIEQARKELEIRERYQAMLNQVREWVPPTHDHDKFKEFMIEQLVSSIDYDCTHYSKKGAPTDITVDYWYNKQLESVKWSIEYHEKERLAEISRAKSRTDWVQALKKSLVE
jgi:hypothetical protein